MRTRFLNLMVAAGLAASAALASACGSNAGNSSGGTGAVGASGGSGGTSNSGGTGGTVGGSGGTASGGTSAGGSSGSSAGGTGGSGTGGTGGTCAKPAVDVTYDLTGSTFSITNTPLGMGDQVNTVQQPYTADKNIGPASIVLRFAASNGNPIPGRADVVKFNIVLDFVVNSTGATVHTDLVQDVTPTVCSGDQGVYNAGVATWQAPGMNPYHSVGDVTCTGTFCSAGGLPNGTPQHRDETYQQLINPFTFTNGVSDFTMPKVLVSSDSSSKTWFTFKGHETSRKASCACQ